MAKNIDLKLRLKGAAKTKKGLGGVDSSLKSLGKSAMAAAGGFFAVRGLIAGFKKSIELSSKMEGLSRGFDNLTKSAGFSTKTFDKLQKATDGTMSSFDLMQQANNAMLLGIFDSEDAMAKMFDTAQRLAKALGKDAAFGVESLITGMGRQSKLMLDNLGIMVKAEDAYKRYAGEIGKTVSGLTDIERKQAFINEAMKEANKLVENLGDEQLTTADSINQMKTSLDDAAIAIGTLLSPVVIDLAKDVKGLAEWWGVWLRNVENTKPSTMSENERTKKLSQEINKLTSEIEHRLEVLRDEELLKKRAEEQGNRLFRQSAIERVQIAELKIELKKLNEEKERQIEIESKKPPELPPPPPLPPLEGFDLFLEKQRENIALKQQESEWLDTIKEQYPELAEAMGLANKKTDDANSGWETFEENLDAAAAASILTASSITSTSDALGAAEEAAKRAATAFISAEIQKAVSKWIASMLESSGPLAWLTAPLALAGGAAFGSLMGSAIERISFAQGGDFVTSGPQSILVGDNPGGRERVSVEPLSSPNINGPKGGITLNISAPLVDETVIDHIIPAIEKAQRNNLA